MKLGLLTACLPDMSLEQVATFAASIGLEALEVAAWPETGGRPFTARHVEVEQITEDQAGAVREMLDSKGLDVSSVAYYDNNLHPDPKVRQAVNDHLIACIDAAVLLGCSLVGTFVGRDPTKTVAENLKQAEQVFPPLVDYAEEQGVHLVIENCVMEGWHPDGYPGNLAYCPELWEWMFSLGLYLNYDPSHLCWMGIDPVDAVRPYLDRVLHAQAKDIEIFPERRNRYGFPGKVVHRDDPWDVGWRR
jgi:sugar phosphate isomerase/epimerase